MTRVGGDLGALAGTVRAMRLGVLDVGSTTVQLLVVQAQPGGPPVPLLTHRVPLRLIDKSTEDGADSKMIINNLNRALGEVHRFAQEQNCEAVLAFGTSALRQVARIDEVLAEVSGATGYSIRVLPGADEARLTFLAARRWLGWSAGRILTLDIGAESVELASGSMEEPEITLELPVGAALVTRSLLPVNPPSNAELRAAKLDVRQRLGTLLGEFAQAVTPQRVVGTSKILRSLAQVLSPSPDFAGTVHLRSTEITAWLPELAALTVAELAALPGASPLRAGKLLAGAVIAEAALELLDVDHLEICPWAVREGMIFRWLDAYRAAEES